MSSRLPGLGRLTRRQLIGTGIGASIALTLAVAGAARMARDWQQIGVRVLGSWTAASALLAIAVRFAR